jgi:ParB family chromosome partitioning protein
VLVKGLADPDRTNRQLTLESLIDEDAVPALTEALPADHPDVRVLAATALTRHGNAAALRPLLDLATAPEPTEKERVPAWLDAAEAALLGLAELCDPAAVAPVRWLLGSDHSRVRRSAAEALARSAGSTSADAHRQALPHADLEVRVGAAFGLALLGDASVLVRLTDEAVTNTLGPGRSFAAVLAVGPAGDQAPAGLLDHADEGERRRAVQVHVLLEFRDPEGTARRLLECLSAKAPRVRLTGAQGVECYADPTAFRAFVTAAVNDRGDDTAWKVTPEVVEAVSAVLVAGPARVKAYLAWTLGRFMEKDQAGWNQAWAGFSKRFAREIADSQMTAPLRTASQLRAERPGTPTSG